MKIIITTIVTGVSIFLLTGCAPKKAYPMELFTSKDGSKVTISHVPSYDFVRDETIAVHLRAGAKKLKENGYNYFTLSEGQGIPYSVKTIPNMMKYCYPASKDGTTLERKCTDMYWDWTSIVGYKTEQLALPTWSVDEVLTDPSYDKLISDGIKRAKFENSEFQFNEKELKEEK